MLDDLMNQMKNMVEQSKSKLTAMEFDMERDGIRVACNGNRVIRDISISPDWLQAGKREELEDRLLALINEVMMKADESTTKAMKDIAGDIMPGGLDGLF